MNRKIGLTTLLILCLLVTACGRNQKEDGIRSGYHIYYVNKDETTLIVQNFSPHSDSTEDLVEELLKELEKPSSSLEYLSAKPDRVKLLDFTLEGENLCLQFDSHYTDMEKTSEVLMRMAYVKTLVQIEGIVRVEFYVDNQPLVDSNGVAIGAMTDDTFVQNDGSEINEYETSELVLYFADEKGDKLVQTTADVIHSTNMSLEKVVVEQLIKGPSANSDLVATIPKDTKVINISTKDGICYVNLSSEFLNLSNDVSADARIYSIVNSLAELSTISKVQISIDGSTKASLAMKISLDTVFERNLDIIETGGQ